MISATVSDRYSARTAFELRLMVYETAVNTSANTSTITYYLRAYKVVSGWYTYDSTAGPWAININGTIVATGNRALDFRSIDTGGYIQIYSGTATVPHGSGGTKTMGFAASHTCGIFGTASTGYGYVTLTAINRVPTAPTIGTISSITATSASIPWSGAVANGGNPIIYYGIIIGTSPGGNNIYNSTDSASPLDSVVYSRFTTYYVQVRAVSATYAASAWSPAKTFKTLAEVPVIGTAYSAISIARNSAVIGGLSVTDNGGQAPTDARVQYNTTASESGASVATRGSWGDVTVSGLDADTEYFYRCAAANSAGWGDYPDTWKSFTTVTGVPDDMAAPTFTSVTDTSMRVNWVAPNLNGATFSAYAYEISDTDTFATTVASGTTSDLYVDIADLTPGTIYYARVRANATPSNGGYGVSSQQTTGIAPNSGCRTYMAIGGSLYQGTLYLAVEGVLQPVAPMYAHDGTLETE
jgi:hypothetical protein